MVTAEQLTAAVKAATAPASSSQAQPQAQSLVLHTGRVAVAAGEKAVVQLGWVMELTRGGASLGALQQLVERWNLADLTDATLGVGKDGKPRLDARGPRATVQQFSRLKAAVKDFDNAWHDANVNVVVRYLSATCIFSLYRHLFSFRTRRYILSPRVSG
jgi:hypothetical protein